MDDKTFINGPGLYYSSPYFKGGGTYKGPYTDPSGMDGQEAVTIDGNEITIQMQTPFPDFPYYASFPAMGPIPEGEVTDPATYAQHPMAIWSVQDQGVHDRQVARARAQRPVGSGNRPGSSRSTPTGTSSKLASSLTRSTRSCSQTAVTAKSR